VFNEEGLRVFGVVDLDPEWQGRTREKGIYTSIAWVPGNLLSEGRYFVAPALKTTAQLLDIYFYVPDAIAFQVVDRMDGPSARGEYVGRLGGIIRPLLEWDTEFSAKK
jgi:lipopolysaccharide transport system ATP-binding protein